MENRHTHTALLIFKKIRSEISSEEQNELNEWVDLDPRHRKLYDELTEEGKLIPMIADIIQFRESIHRKIEQRENIKLSTKKLFVQWPYWSAAAAFFIFLMGVLFALFNQTITFPSRSAYDMAIEDVAAPHRSNATLTLSNGKVVRINSLEHDTTSLSAQSQLVKDATGNLIYLNDDQDASEGMHYGTLSNPLGSAVTSLKLADGTKIWLNTGSSITFPLRFTGGKRAVAIEGEVYLEVAPDAKKPFILSKGNAHITVLGTTFNVNAYDNVIRTALLEGTVRISTPSHEVVLRPGEEARITKGSEYIHVTEAELEKALAWRSEYFKLDLFTFPEMMKQIERWYDIQIVLADSDLSKIRLHGELKRNTTLDGLVKVLEYSGIQCRLVPGRKLVLSKLRP